MYMSSEIFRHNILCDFHFLIIVFIINVCLLTEIICFLFYATCSYKLILPSSLRQEFAPRLYGSCGL